MAKSDNNQTVEEEKTVKVEETTAESIITKDRCIRKPIN
jgi:hypothetical protein